MTDQEIKHINKSIKNDDLVKLLKKTAIKTRSFNDFMIVCDKIAAHVHTIRQYKNDFQSDKRRMTFYLSNIEFIYKTANILE